MEEVTSLRNEVDELRTALTTVSEALILFQEFIEVEIGEMSYFRDSGSHHKLVEVFNKLRVCGVGESRRNIQSSPLPLVDYKHVQVSPASQLPKFDMQLNFTTPENQFGFTKTGSDDEEKKVDIDMTEEGDCCDEITINKVYSVSPLTPKSSDSAQSPTSNSQTFSDLMPVNLSQKINEAAEGKASALPLNLTIKPQVSEDKEITAPVKKRRRRSSKRASKPLNLTCKKKTTRTRTKPRKISQPKNSPAKDKNLLPKRKKANSAAGKRSQSLNPVQCPVCFRGYSSRGVMSRHMKEAHQVEPQFPCFYCPEKFRNGPVRLDHMQRMHPDDFESVVCPYCKRISTTITGKRNHMMLCARKYQHNVPLPSCSKPLTPSSPPV